MIIVGFGFLMTFLKRYSWSSLGFNFLFTAFTVQWAILVQGWFFDSAHGEDHNDTVNGTNATVEAHTGSDISHLQFVHVDLLAMIEAEFSSGCILISFGAVLGVASPVQLLIMIILEIVFYKVRFIRRTQTYPPVPLPSVNKNRPELIIITSNKIYKIGVSDIQSIRNIILTF